MAWPGPPRCCPTSRTVRAAPPPSLPSPRRAAPFVPQDLPSPPRLTCPDLCRRPPGTWFTWWHSYTEAEAKDDLEHWEAGELPIDVWALDMNWRNTSAGQDRYYDHPATALFPDFEAWFAFLQAHGLKTYFNDREWAATRTGGYPNRRDHPLTLTGGAGPNPLTGGRWVASG